MIKFWILTWLFAVVAKCHHPSIKVVLALKKDWISPPFGLELIQYVKEENPEKMLEFVEWLKEEKRLVPNETPSDLFQFIKENKRIVEQRFLLNGYSGSLLNVSLATHSGVPAIQAYYHYYTKTIVPSLEEKVDSIKACSCWVDWGSIERICNPDLIADMQMQAPDFQNPKLLSIDNHYRKLKGDGKTVILYADVLTSVYSQFYAQLTQFANKHEDFDFVVRWIPSLDDKIHNRFISLSGYGVELALKNTEYQAVDDRNVKDSNEDKSVIEEKEADSIKDQDVLFQKEPVIENLKMSKLEVIAPAAIGFASQTKNPFASLVKVSQEFPKVAHLLKSSGWKSVSKLSSNIMGSIVGDRQILLLNGIPLDIERLNAFEILRLLKSENRLIQQLLENGLSLNQVHSMIEKPLELESNSLPWGNSFNCQSNAILWLNDLERDPMYSHFPKELMSILRGYPGRFKFVAKNVFSVVLFLDFTADSHLQEFMKLYDIIRQQIPFRFGVVPILDRQSSHETKLLVQALTEIIKKDKAMLLPFVSKLLKSAKIIDVVAIKLFFKEVTGNVLADIDDQVKDDAFQEILEINKRLGISRSGAVFANGMYLTMTPEWPQSTVNVYFSMMSHLGNALLSAEVNDDTNIYQYFNTLPAVIPKRNPAIFPNSPDDVDIVQWAKVDLHKFKWIPAIESPSSSLVVFGDISTPSGRAVMLQSLEAKKNMANTRLLLVDTSSQNCGDLSLYKEADKLIAILQDFKSCSSTNDQTVKDIRGLFKIPDGYMGSILNSRQIEIGKENPFEASDFKALLIYESPKRIAGIAEEIKKIFGTKELSSDEFADKVLVVSSILSFAKAQNPDSAKKRSSMTMLESFESSEVHFSHGDAATSHFRFLAIVQPTTPTGQKIISLLDKFRLIEGAHTQVFALGVKVQDVEKLPLLRFYSFVFDVNPSFSNDGAVLPTVATFPHLPVASLMTLGMDVPDAWLVRPKKSIYDLDNIKLSAVPQGRNLEAEFALEYLLVQGHATDSDTQAPPRGLQFVLGTFSDEDLDDTITMANLGYVQLKGGPGVWEMKIREGRSSQVYQLDKLQSEFNDTRVVVDSFEGVQLFPKVSKRPGMKDVDVLDDGNSDTGNMWSNLKTSIFGGGEKKNASLNVFTVASGHLYERFMAIMMLSVKKNTKANVKFWLIENFLSPSFLEFLPHLAKAFDFDYELVTYKWPHWLRKQTEKQRIIWGYKILFLDVLFPLSLDKVIFVDADQVVRTDLMELVNLDLKGAVYGYTPFCSSRKEMDGFRFWKGGYWEHHLDGRAYHISALYVIDLVKFRALAAGDRLRQQYHLLSADPNSLANLDQDLPNNMIHEISIFSLPQDWLWCETWCSDESLKTAKTIDLCNNPLTKEPKLDRAKRILPEWVGLDNEVNAVREKYQSSTKPSSSSWTSAKSSASSSTSPEPELRDEL